MEAIQENSEMNVACSLEPRGYAISNNQDSQVFLRGLIIGFGIAAAAGVVWGLFRNRRQRLSGPGYDSDCYRGSGSSAGVMEGISNIIEGGATAFKDAVDAVDRTCQSVTRGIETVQDAFDKIGDL
jgi:hypothetical protein